MNKAYAYLRSRLHSSFLVPFIDQGVTSAANVLIGIILARSCDKSEFGLYTLGLTIIFFGLNFQTSVIWTPYTVFVPRMTYRSRLLYTGSTFAHQGISSLALILSVLIFFVFSRFQFEDGRFTQLFLVISVAIVPFLFREYCRKICFATLRFFSALKLDFAVSISQISSMIVVLYFFHLSATIVFLIISICSGLAALVWLLNNRNLFAISHTDVVSDWGKNWNFGKWVLASSMLWGIQAYVTPWVVSHIRGLESAGAWAACVGAIAVGNPILLATQNYTAPTLANTFASHGVLRLESQVKSLSIKIGSVSVLFLAILAAIGEQLVVLMYGSLYRGYGAVIIFLALNFVFSVIQVPLTNAFFILDRVRLDFFINLITLLLFVFTILPSVHHSGILGAAGVLALCSGTSVCIKFVGFRLISKEVHASDGEII